MFCHRSVRVSPVKLFQLAVPHRHPYLIEGTSGKHALVFMLALC